MLPWLRVALLSAVVAASGLLALPGEASARPLELRAVSANLGNVNVPGCGQHVFKLCLRPVEERARASFRALDPDLVALQEVLPAALCQQTPSSNPANLCSGPLEPPDQALRLLGPDVHMACDLRFAWECLTARPPHLHFRDVRTLPAIEGCDPGFTLIVGELRIQRWPVAIANGHANSTNARCRATELQAMFAALDHGGPAIALGDFNLDPFRERDESTEVWERYVPEPFRYASGDEITSIPAGPSQLDPTGEVRDGGLVLDPPGPLGQRTLDHVVVRGVGGSCAPLRIDGGGGMDHKAQVCRLLIPPEVTPTLRVRRLPPLRRCAVEARLDPTPPHLRGFRVRLGGRSGSVRGERVRVRQRSEGARGRQALEIQPVLDGPDGPVIRRPIAACRR